MNYENHKTEAGAVIDALRAGMAAQPITIRGIPGYAPEVEVPLLAVPGVNGVTVQSIKKHVDEWRDCPERKVGFDLMQTAESLIDHALRFKSEDSTLYCDMDEPAMCAVYNDHQREAEEGSHAGWRDFGAEYRMPLSDEWERWTEASDEWMTPSDFAEFLEANIMDVAPYSAEAAKDPTAVMLGGKVAGGDTILGLSREVQVYVSQDIKTKIDLSSGEGVLSASEEHRDAKGKPVKIPTMFRITIPVFVDGDPVTMFVRLRYRVRGGVVWRFSIHDADRVFTDAVKTEAERISEEAGLPLFYGKMRSR